MNTNVHPDDEKNLALAAMLLKDGISSVVLTATRGASGQNAIGSESGWAYAAVRTRELQESLALIGSEHVILCTGDNDTSLDFGFSKRWEEVYNIWNWDYLLERVVWNYRYFRPDVVTNQTSGIRTQHGQHQALAMICYAAYIAAADPNMFPQHFEKGVRPFKIPRFMEFDHYDETFTHLSFKGLDFANRYFENTLMYNQPDYRVTYDGSGFCPVFGLSFNQLGQESRYFHISQSMGQTEKPGGHGNLNGWLVDTPLPEWVKSDYHEEPLFHGIPMTLADLARTGNVAADTALVKLQSDVDNIIASFANHSVLAELIHLMMKNIAAAIELISASSLDEGVQFDITHKLSRKLSELSEASRQATLLSIKMYPSTFTPYVGQILSVPVEIFNGGKVDVNISDVQLNVPDNWIVKGKPNVGSVSFGQTLISEFELAIPTVADCYSPFNDMPMTTTVTYEVAGISNSCTVGFNKKPVGDGKHVRFAVMPRYSLAVSPENFVLNTLKEVGHIPVTVGVTSYIPGDSMAKVSLDIPDGWALLPESALLNFSGSGEVQVAEFKLTPSSDFKEERVEIAVKVIGSDGLVSNTTVQTIEYPHIGRTYYLHPASITIQGVEVVVPDGFKLAYVDGGRDLVFKYLEQIGFDVTLLEPQDVLYGDLSQFSAIMCGIRAYRDRDDLISANSRFQAYVESGGRMIVNYMQVGAGDRWQPHFAPLPLVIGAPTAAWRVVEEDSQITLLVPDHPIFQYPNKIVSEDWDGWVVERSIYNINLAASHESWTALISAMDTDDDINVPGRQAQDGMIVTTNHGAGVYTYTSVVWWRQIQGLVPGAYRILTNIITHGQWQG